VLGASLAFFIRVEPEESAGRQLKPKKFLENTMEQIKPKTVIPPVTTILPAVPVVSQTLESYATTVAAPVPPVVPAVDAAKK